MSSSTNACPFWIEAVVDHLSSDAMNGYLDSSSPSINDAAAIAIVMVAGSDSPIRRMVLPDETVGEGAMSNLIALRDENEWTLRLQAVRAILMIGQFDEVAMEVLTALSNDANQFVAREAREALRTAY
jgi:hypothetical protein